MKFFIKDFFSECDQIRRKLRIWSHLLKKSLMGNFIFLYSVIYFLKKSFIIYVCQGPKYKSGFCISLRKIPSVHLISWCKNFVERRSFHRVSGESPKTQRKLYHSTKFSDQDISWNYSILHSVYILNPKYT